MISYFENYYYTYKVKRLIKSLKLIEKSPMIFGIFKVIEPQNISIGLNCRINEGVFFHGGGGIEIADNVTLSAFCKIISFTYDVDKWRDNYIDKKHIGMKVYIGEGTWIGAEAIILPGVSIRGKGNIIAAGAVVNRSIDGDFQLIAGNPAKIVKKY